MPYWLFYRLPKGVRVRARGELTPGVEVESGTYTDLPSSSNRAVCRWVNLDPVAPAPQRLLDLIAAAPAAEAEPGIGEAPGNKASPEIAPAAAKIEGALEAVRRGFRIFPVIPNGKVPAIRGWQFAATRDEARIRAWFEENPDYNFGGVTDGLLVLDADVRNGGMESFSELNKEHPGFAKSTLVTRTASGGNHVVFTLPDGVRVKSNASKIASGLDIRSGSGAFIVLPGSVVDGNEYVWANNNEKKTAPQWLIDRCQMATPRDASAGERVVEEDDEAVELATVWLEKHAPAGESGDRDNTAFRVAASVYDYGVSRATAVDLLMRWNEERCSPPLGVEDIQRVAASAERSRENAIGSAHPKAAGFEPVEIAPRALPAPAPAPAKQKFYSLRADQSAKRALQKPREWLIEDIMHVGAEGVLIGAPGSGKTFCVLDMGYHVAKGLPWAGHAAAGCPVVYVAAEAQEGIHSRILALEKHYGPLGDTPLYVIPVAPDLAHGLGDVQALVAEIKANGERAGRPVGLVIVDTLNRAISGGDENSSKDMGAVLMAMRIIREQTAAASLIVHHPGKDATKGGRGHSSVWGAVDSDMRISDHTLTVVKLRDAPEGTKVAFRLKPVRVGFDAKDREVTSCYIEIRAEGDPDFTIRPAPGGQLILDAIDWGLKGGDQPFTVKQTGIWLAEMQAERYPASGEVKGEVTLTNKEIQKRFTQLHLGNHLKKVQYGQYVRVVHPTSP